MMASRSPTRVERLRSPEEWDAFVATAPDATFFHRAAWKDVLESAFGFRSHWLTARRDGRLVGVLPLCELRPPFGRPRLLSLPFAVEAGVSAADDDARRALDDAAVRLARDVGARTLELRDDRRGDGFHAGADVFSRFRRTLAAGEEEDWARIPRKRRHMIRRAQHSGLWAHTSAGLDVFYDLYACSQRRLGTPVLPRDYFAALLRHFGADSVVLTVFRGDTAVAGVLSFVFRDGVLPYYAGSRPQHMACGSNDFMYWELMRWARRRGLRTFDFGRSRRGSGAFDYKRHWGFAAEPLPYRIRSFGRAAARRRTVDDAPIRMLSWGWKQLPLPLTKSLGPVIARRFAPYFT